MKRAIANICGYSAMAVFWLVFGYCLLRWAA